MLNVKTCKKCGLPDGVVGMLEDGIFISDVAYYNGRGSLQAEPVKVNLGAGGICNVCNRPKNFKPLNFKERIEK